MTEALADLLRRVEEASWANFQLECDICAALGEHEFPPPKVTASIDAAVALAERVLPGWEWSLNNCKSIATDPTRPFEGMVEDGNDNPEKRFFVEHVTPALALCAAILKAKAGSQ